MPSTSKKSAAGRPRRNEPDVYLLVAKEIARRGFELPDGAWAYGAVKMILEDCIRNHLGPVARKRASVAARTAKAV